MSEAHHRDPILDPPRRKGLSSAILTGIVVSVGLHAAVLFYVLNERFKLIPYIYHDEAQKVELVKLPPPPPPPKQKPPPPPKVEPPKVQPREVKPPPLAIAQPPPIPIQAVKKEERKEYTQPPVVVAAPPPPAPHVAVITNPQWIRLPDTSDLDRYYPPAAKERGTEGRATVECTVKDDGTLTNCEVVSEEPSGAGFGSATVRAASRFKMRPKTVDGAPVGGARVRVPLRWKLSG
jgi:protein TonB